MKLASTLQVSTKAIIINKVRSLLTMLGIIIGVAAIILLVSIGAGIQSFVNEQFETLGSTSVFVLPGTGGVSAGPPIGNVSKFDNEIRTILFEQEIDKIHPNLDKGTIKLVQPNLKTSIGIIKRHTYESVERANETERLLVEQKGDQEE